MSRPHLTVQRWIHLHPLRSPFLLFPRTYTEAYESSLSFWHMLAILCSAVLRYLFLWLFCRYGGVGRHLVQFLGDVLEFRLLTPSSFFCHYPDVIRLCCGVCRCYFAVDLFVVSKILRTLSEMISLLDQMPFKLYCIRKRLSPRAEDRCLKGDKCICLASAVFQTLD